MVLTKILTDNQSSLAVNIHKWNVIFHKKLAKISIIGLQPLTVVIFNFLVSVGGSVDNSF